MLVRLFYSLSDGTTPFVISTLAIAANVALDSLFVLLLGAPGLVAATAAVNVLSALALFVASGDRLKGETAADLRRLKGGSSANPSGTNACVKWQLGHL